MIFKLTAFKFKYSGTHAGVQFSEANNRLNNNVRKRKWQIEK